MSSRHLLSSLSRLTHPRPTPFTRSFTRSFTSSPPLSIPPTMRAAVVHTPGPASHLKVESSYPTPSPSSLLPGEVLVKNHFAGINFIDTYHRSGLYPREFPFVGGQEGGGEIAFATPEAQALGLEVGDRVAYSVFGSYAEYTKVPAAKLLPVPASIPLSTATACVVQSNTAHYLVSSAPASLIAPGQWMLIHGVAGGTCQWAAQIAKILGYKVIGTCPRGKLPVAKELGCDELIVLDEVEGQAYEDYESVDVVKRVMEITNDVGCHAVIDGIGKATVDISIDSLARRGIFVSFGNASGAVPAFPVLRLIGKSAYVTRPKLLDYTATREELLERSGDVMRWIDEGKLKIGVDKIFDIEDAKEGHLYLESGASTGKVLYKL